MYFTAEILSTSTRALPFVITFPGVGTRATQLRATDAYMVCDHVIVICCVGTGRHTHVA